MRRAVLSYLKKGVKNGRKWPSLMGFTVENLREHLASQFTDGMTWENYGSYWHIDHIKPVAAFSFLVPEDQDFKDCWSLSNLQPLKAKENLSKGSFYQGKKIYGQDSFSGRPWVKRRLRLQKQRK
jgi:hypothetical protein